jgi:hypothetical protein
VVGRLTGLYFGVDAATLLLVFRATSSTLHDATVGLQARSILALALARFEQGLGIIEHEQAPLGSE